MNLIIIIVLILLSGLFSGLTLGLLSLNKTDLETKIKLGDKAAKKIYEVRKNGNFLLCTLLLGNVATNAFLSILLGSLVNGLIAGIIATSLIVVFGEIIPQAVFSRYSMKLGAKLVFLVKIFNLILYPVSYPLSYLLDKLLGDELPNLWTKDELKEIIKIHEDSHISDIDADEERIMLGALSFSNKKVEKIMTPRTVCHFLNEKKELNQKTIKQIKENGFSRIPVYQKNIDNIVGILYVKDLIGIKKNEQIKNLYRKKFLIVDRDDKIDNLLNIFAKSKVHIAVVKNKFGSIEGVVTLEDIIEEIFRIEIVDETDKIEDLQEEAKIKAKSLLAKNLL
jgi:metal transporter CNNM